MFQIYTFHHNIDTVESVIKIMCPKKYAYFFGAELQYAYICVLRFIITWFVAMVYWWFIVCFWYVIIWMGEWNGIVLGIGYIWYLHNINEFLEEHYSTKSSMNKESLQESGHGGIRARISRKICRGLLTAHPEKFKIWFSTRARWDKGASNTFISRKICLPLFQMNKNWHKLNINLTRLSLL